MRKKILAGLLSAALFFTMIPSMASAESPGTGSLNSGQGKSTLEEIAGQVQDHSDDLFSSSVKKTARASYPAQFDLRDRGLVTPVKFQNPFGTCWGFAAIAAAETSILGSDDPEVRGDYTKDTLDLSEKHLVYFVAQAIDDSANSQNGEGAHSVPGVTLADKLNRGGLTFVATNLFASGIGPVVENGDEDEPTLKYRGSDRSVEFRFVDGKLTEYCYDDEDDWSLPEEYRFLQTFVLKESYMLPSPAHVDEETRKYEYNPEGTQAIKEQLMNNRAVSIAFCADTSSPSQEAGDGQYISTNWAHYTYDSEEDANHAVTIVGWDDNYPATNFIKGHEPKDEKGHLLNGAWLIKNSWGSQEEDFPNRGPGWGLENETGQHTGYFWLSYYDKSLAFPEALAFDRNNEAYNEAYWVDAHDYMPPNDLEGASVPGISKMSNVFKARACQSLEAVSCQTSYPGTKVVSQVYLLPDGFRNPTDGILVASTEGQYEYGGFHKMKLDSPVLIQKGQYYSIVQTMTSPDGEYTINMPMALNEIFSKAMGENTWMKGVVNKKESYLFSDGKWYDYGDKAFLKTLLGDSVEMMALDNFPIKGYCRMQPDISIRVSGDTTLDLENGNQSTLRVSFKGHDGSAVEPDITWKLSDEGSGIFTVEENPGDPFKATVTANAVGRANLFVTVKGAGTTVVPLSVKKLEIVSATIYQDTFVYNGKEQKPAVEVTDSFDQIVDPKHYTLKYSNNKKCGLAKVTVVAKPDSPVYEGQLEFDFMIRPAKAVIKSLSVGKNSLTVTIKDQKASGVKSYDVSYRVKGTSAWKTKKTTSNKILLKGLKGGKKYQVRVRAREAYYEDLDDYNVGAYSAVKTSGIIKTGLAKPVIKSLKAQKNRLVIILKGKKPAQVKKYQVRYRIKGKKKWTTKTYKAAGNKIIVKKLRKKKQYQVKVRSLKNKNTMSSYSKVKTSKKIK